MKIVIVDDEIVIVKWLKKNIEEISSDYQVVECFRNGKQALEYCMTHEVDILFADIRMPVMDGIELVRRLGTNRCSVYVIILSAYDDFSYAREAFKLGVNEFILKAEITKEGLRECLGLARACLLKQSSESQKNEDEFFITRITKALEATECSDLQQVQVMLNECQNDWKFSEYTVSVLDYGAERNSNAKEKIGELIRYLAEEERIIVLQIPIRPGIVIFITNLVENRFSIWIQKMYHTFSSFQFENICLGSSLPGYHLTSLPLLFEQAQKACEFQKFYFQKEIGIFSDAIIESDFAKPQEYYNKLLKQIANHQMEELHQSVGELFDLIQQFKPAVALVQNMTINLMLQLYMEIYAEQYRSRLEIEEIIRLGKADTVLLLKSQVLKKISACLETVSTTLQFQRYSDSVLRIMDYVEKHYRENITLENVANEVHLNRTYISALFRKETGERFYDYILDYRLVRAAELLKTTNQRIQLISEQVGISDCAYFSRRFKQKYGKTPIEYRKTKTESQKI